MDIDITNAKKEADDLCKYLGNYAQKIVDEKSKEIDKIVEYIRENVDCMTNDDIRKYMTRLSIESYFFGQYKEKSALLQECAITIEKENLATEFSKAEGTQNARQNIALINTSDKRAVTILYNGVSNLMKTKLDEIHRLINTLSNIIISRSADAKLMGMELDKEKYIKEKEEGEI